MIKIIFLLLALFLIGAYLYGSNFHQILFQPKQPDLARSTIEGNASKPLPSDKPKIQLNSPPSTKLLANNYHIFQTFNNCGPAALSMALSYYGINKSQAELGQILRPYQIPSGNNDDKSVTLEELAEHSKSYGLIPYHRPNGSIEKIKLFISYDIPIITRTWLKADEDIGHYRVVKGYDEASKQIIQDDSLQGKNLKYSYEDFLTIWEKFNYEYLVLIPEEKKEVVEAILGDDLDTRQAFEKSLKTSQEQLKENPENIYAKFNESIAYYHLGDYENTVSSFEVIETKLPFRTLWYQIEPILAYQKLKRYDRVFSVIDKILNNQNRAFSELYQIRGEIYLEQGKPNDARAEFQKAIEYNMNYPKPQQSIKQIEEL